MHPFTYVSSRYGQKIQLKYATLDEALKWAWLDLEHGEAWPIEIRENDVVWKSNEGGKPWIDGSCPLNDALYAWARANGRDDDY